MYRSLNSNVSLFSDSVASAGESSEKTVDQLRFQKKYSREKMNSYVFEGCKLIHAQYSQVPTMC